MRAPIHDPAAPQGLVLGEVPDPVPAPGQALVGVLVTGASGGVGRFVVQLAARAGAHVIAAVGSEARGEGLPRLGASEAAPALLGRQILGKAVLNVDFTRG